MKKFSAFFSIIALACLPALDANAGSGSWTNTGNQPTLYQTNYWYDGAIIPALAGTPPGAIITSANMTWGYTSKPSGIEAKICVGTKCGYTTVRNDLYDTYWNGSNATQNVRFSFWVPESTTHILNPYVYPSNQSSTTITYSY